MITILISTKPSIPPMKVPQPPTLAALHPGESGTILALRASEELRRRLAALGVREGKHVHILRRGRFAGPLLIRVGTTDLMMRRTDASCIQVQRSNRG